MIVVVDIGIGNLGSLKNMLKKIGVEATVTSDPKEIEKADKLILPGVGAFDSARESITQLRLEDVLQRRVIEGGVPVLGVCLGMQLLTENSEEGRLPGLGWIAGETVRFDSVLGDRKLRVPHMGWNIVKPVAKSPLFDDIEEEARFYFVHSYYVRCKEHQSVLAETEYGVRFASVIGQDNIVGVQFHPEKSHKFGLKILANYVEKI